MPRKFTFDWDATKKKIEDGQASKNTTEKDPRSYYPNFKEDGTAQAIIRFLPAMDQDVPYVQVYSHNFQHNNHWYINKCLTTHGKQAKCPMCEYNQEHWNSYNKMQQDQYKRKQKFTSNILVVKDPLNPENNGKVFLFHYGYKIYDKIMKTWNPGQDSIDTPINVFDYYDGANFKLIITKTSYMENGKKKNSISYDACKFDNPSAISEDENEIERIHKSLFPLKEFVTVGFKTYDELKKDVDRVFNGKPYVAKSNDVQVPESSIVTEEEIKDSMVEEDVDFDSFLKK